MRILIQGASIAGPVLAYWLTKSGHDVTVVERAPGLRKTGGHAIDLFRPAMEISERMGVLSRIEARATGTAILMAHRPWSTRPARIDYLKLEKAMSDRHVEIMRDDLSEIYYDAARDDVEYLFGDSIASISGDGDVTFTHAAGRRFDAVVGADGLHSGVRQLVFGDVQERFLGGYLSVVSVPKSLAREVGSRNVTVNVVAPGFIATDMTAQLPAEQQQQLVKQVSVGRLGSVEDIAHAVAFLASPQAGYITGETLHVNGGMYMV